jgi:transposase
MSKDTAIAVDVAKNVFQVGVSERPGRLKQTLRLQRAQFLAFLATQPACTVVMEACGSAQFWAGRIQQLGHRVILLPPHLVRPYVRGNKTDRTDVKGILEAYRNEEIRPVPIKTPSHQALAALHRLRSAWVAERTARLNPLRGLLRELGIFIPVGARKVIPEVWAHLGDADSAIPDSVRPFLAEACAEVRDIERRIVLIERQLESSRTRRPHPEVADRPRCRAAHGDRALRLRSGYPPVPVGSTPRQLSRADTTRALEWQHEKTRRDHQAR